MLKCGSALQCPFIPTIYGVIAYNLHSKLNSYEKDELLTIENVVSSSNSNVASDTSNFMFYVLSELKNKLVMEVYVVKLHFLIEDHYRLAL